MAEELARSSGTPEEILQTVLAHDFLKKCLRKAKFSDDLLQDTLDACDINDLNALVLGSGLLTVTQASEKLFLMQDEANTVVTVCRKECLRAGVNFGDGAQLTPEELAENDEEPAPAPASAPPPAPAAPTHPAIQIPPAPTHMPSSRASPGAMTQPSKTESVVTTPVSAAHTPTQAAAAATVALPSPPPATAAPKEPAAAEPLVQRPATTTPSSGAEHPDPNFLTKPPVSASSIPPAPGTATPSTTRSHIPKPTTTTPATPAAAVATPRGPAAKPATRASPSTSVTSPPTSSGGAYDSGNRSTVTPAMNGKYTSANSSAAKPPRPSSAPLTARASTTAPLGKDRPSSALATPPLQKSTNLPSYAKPTASHKARLLKEDSDVPSTSAPPPITFASTNKPLRRLLYMPPRPTSTTPEEKKEPKKPIFDNIRSNLLRPTAAFLAWSSGKNKSATNADLRASQSLQDTRPLRGPNSAPPKSREFSATTMLSPSMTQGPFRTTTTPEPFRLASTERHQKAQEELQKKKEEKARLESQIPKFKASPMPSPGFTSIPKPEAKKAISAQTDA